jgi:hypothetical protein
MTSPLLILAMADPLPESENNDRVPYKSVLEGLLNAGHPREKIDRMMRELVINVKQFPMRAPGEPVEKYITNEEWERLSVALKNTTRPPNLPY